MVGRVAWWEVSVANGKSWREYADSNRNRFAAKPRRFDAVTAVPERALQVGADAGPPCSGHASGVLGDFVVDCVAQLATALLAADTAAYRVMPSRGPLAVL